jgi:hypothetical protein
VDSSVDLLNTMVAYSTMPGQPSYRGRIKGTVFVSVLVEQIVKDYKSLSLQEILENTKIAVKMKIERDGGEATGCTQVCDINHTGLNRGLTLLENVSYEFDGVFVFPLICV